MPTAGPTKGSSGKPRVRNISCVAIIARASDPSQMFMEIKDDGLPVKRFRRCLNPCGGNWWGDEAINDRGPRQTLERELGEEFSFNRSLRSSVELVGLGLIETGDFQPAVETLVKPTDEEVAALAALSERIIECLEHFGCYINTVSAAAFQAADPAYAGGDLDTLTFYFTALLNEADWAALMALQEKFGNLSNESITVATSAEEIVEQGLEFAYGHDTALRDFLQIRSCFPRPNAIRTIPGVTSKSTVHIVGDYSYILEVFDVERLPTGL